MLIALRITDLNTTGSMAIIPAMKEMNWTLQASSAPQPLASAENLGQMLPSAIHDDWEAQDPWFKRTK